MVQREVVVVLFPDFPGVLAEAVGYQVVADMLAGMAVFLVQGYYQAEFVIIVAEG